ncbi:peptidoglycan transpeptidase precursor (ErfK-YbiS-YhnG family) [Tamaricihabitans halophyticus]|uniref:Peptidoglycan transpeptidase (ErfK-YbiS-YhnG family) n=1 Tax=Tamaricihabitans halophyticus TaxID=1262583 RepID=A0A4R2QCT6_9PSEU|nr:Ig-like domain-containing protein [Tamaricihabitans halophyticus]TCP46840.1 peptidoglycan transpeptidase precursor (ErfK-YbiS-YhnG family) [Tamaricihabitans halophyticus]
MSGLRFLARHRGGANKRDRITGSARAASVAGLAALTLTVVTALAGCTPSPAEQVANTGQQGSAKPSAPSKPISMKLNPSDGANDVEPGKPITVTAEHGKLSKVTLTGEDGTPVKGKIVDDGARWVSGEPLGFGKGYTAKAVGTGSDGERAVESSSFRTATPQGTATVSVQPTDGETVGVGQPLIFTFSTNIPDKEAAEEALRVSTDPVTDGAFYWFDDATVHWRPKEYWTSGTNVDINAAIYGKDLGGGIYGGDDQRAKVQIGDRVVVIADGASYQMSVSINGKQVRKMPISMGKPGYDTPHGTYVAMSEHQGYTMDSTTYGVAEDAPEGYRIWVEIATRMSYSGIFYHSAPWSVAQQGSEHSSHGCINLSSEDARWLQGVSNKGDVIIVRNTDGPKLEPTDGWGDWQIPWEQWLSGGKRNG